MVGAHFVSKKNASVSAHTAVLLFAPTILVVKLARLLFRSGVLYAVFFLFFCFCFALERLLPVTGACVVFYRLSDF